MLCVKFSIAVFVFSNHPRVLERTEIHTRNQEKRVRFHLGELIGSELLCSDELNVPLFNMAFFNVLLKLRLMSIE